MIEFLLLLLSAYSLLLLLVNAALGRGISVKGILWLQLLYIRVSKSSFNLKIGSISLTVRPFGLLSWNKNNKFGGSLLKLNLSNIVLSLNDATSNHTDNSQTEHGKLVEKTNNENAQAHTSLTKEIQRILQILSRFYWLLPIEVSVHNFALRSCDTLMKTQGLSFCIGRVKHTGKDSRKCLTLSMQLEISGISVNECSVLNNLKINIQLDSPLNSQELSFKNVSISVNINGLDMNIDMLSKPLSDIRLASTNKGQKIDGKVSKSSNAEKKNDLIDIVKATRISNLSVSADKIFMKYNGIDYLSDGFFFGIDSKCPELQRLLSTNFHKAAISIASLTVNPEKYPKLKLQMNFINFASLIDIRRTIFAFSHINEQDYGNHISKEDPFLVRSFFTITNFNMSASLDDFLLRDSTGKKQRMNPKIYIYWLRRMTKTPTPVQKLV